MSTVRLSDGPAPGVHVMTLDDPDKRNAMSPRLLADLREAIDAVATDRAARTLVVAASGSAFCAGADLAAIFGEPDRAVGLIREDLRRVYDSFLRIRRLEIPTIAAIQGPAVGAGANLALACDLRVAGPLARIGITFTKLGLHPGGGCTALLTAALGPQRALKIILDGATLDAAECVRLGLVLEIVDDPVARALDLAGTYAAIDPELTRDIKRAVGLAATGDFDATLDFESWAQAASAQKPQITAAVADMRARSSR